MYCFLSFSFLVFFLPIHFLPTKPLYSVEFMIVKMWQQFNGCFQLLDITNSTWQEHLAETTLKLKIVKEEKFSRGINVNLWLFHLDYVTISAKLLSRVPCFPPRHILNVGILRRPQDSGLWTEHPGNGGRVFAKRLWASSACRKDVGESLKSWFKRPPERPSLVQWGFRRNGMSWACW